MASTDIGGSPILILNVEEVEDLVTLIHPSEMGATDVSKKIQKFLEEVRAVE